MNGGADSRMEGVIAGVFGMVQNRKEANAREDDILLELDSVKQSLEMVAARFNYQNDPDLLEACIYEMKALNARFRYLTREARRQGLTRSTLSSLKRVE